jgi:hypothetical protein
MLRAFSLISMSFWGKTYKGVCEQAGEQESERFFRFTGPPKTLIRRASDFILGKVLQSFSSIFNPIFDD